MPRNNEVEQSVSLIIDLLDNYIDGKGIKNLPSSKVMAEIDYFVKNTNSGSVLLASTFLLAYSIIALDFDFKKVPIGIRGKFGDKKLSNELNRRHVTIHNRVVAFGENLGWKGNVGQFDLSTDERFKILKSFSNLSKNQRNVLLNYLMWHYFESIQKPKVIPMLDDSYLTYGRCVNLFDKLIKKKSEGYYPQFLISAILFVHRKGLTEIKTHHPHAADKFDGTFGDIEEYFNKRLVAAYEITVRPDWRNRIEGFKNKMINSGLNKYVLIAGDVASDSSTNTAESLLKFTENVGFDLAVVDIYEFVRVFVGDMTSVQLILVINKIYEYLLDDKLCGRITLINDYQMMINKFLIK
jgi:hypothetical protein